MDKAVLKKFAIELKQDLMQRMENKIKTFYIDEEFSKQQSGDVYILANSKHSLNLSKEEYTKRELLIKRINELGLDQVIEEAAYTWFNRIVAIRYMEIHDYLPLTRDNQSLGIRVLSSKDNTPDPEILKFSNLINPDLDINFDKEKYITLKSDNEKFEYILLLICQKLGKVIPQVFDGATDYIDILIPDNLLNDTGFVTKLINEVPENNFEQVEIIGWLYQYYNQVEKDKVISSRKAYKKNEIAYATQLFTPDWIVKYMVENSLGRYWIEHSNDKTIYSSDNRFRNSLIIENWKYFIKENINYSDLIVNPKDITFLDPCCGSGHILVYAFELFYQIYLKCGFNKNEIAEIILRYNLYGLDIDDRAGQLSILSVLLKAREYDKNIFNKNIVKDLNIVSFHESNNISYSILDNIVIEENKTTAKYLIDMFKNAKEIGSLLILEKKDYSNLIKEINDNETIFGIELKEKLLPLIQLATIIEKSYSIVVTNPPYMNNNVMSQNLKNYIQEHFKNVKSDLFSSFIVRNSLYGDNNSYVGFMTPYVWMFISSYEELRKFVIEEVNISSLIQLEYSALEEATVPICTFVLDNNKKSECGIYFRLTDFSGGMQIQEQKYLEILNDDSSKYKYQKNARDFLNIPGKPIAYWADKFIFNLFKEQQKIGDMADVKIGMGTGKNDLFLRDWWETNYNHIDFSLTNISQLKDSNGKFFPYNKGGDYRLWYGNLQEVIWYDEKARNIMKGLSGHRENGGMNYYFMNGITWSFISSSKFGVRYRPSGSLFDVAGSTLFLKEDNLYKVLGFLSSKVCNYLIKMLNPTLNYQAGNIKSLPIMQIKNADIDEIVKKNIEISKDDWDSFETSWDFVKHPLLKPMSKVSTIRDSIANWNTYTYQQRSLLKHNEEELNKIFIDIYGLNNELTPEVDYKDITIRKEDKVRDIKSFISYAVGCMFGRYSLDKEGLIYAGGDFDNIYQKYKKADGGWAGSSLSNYKYLNDNGNEIELSFEVDNDNIIPINDEAYFSDDIVERFKTFLKTVYGDNTFNENMDYIAEALGKKGTETSEETIRRYFVNDFFNDHVKMYQKRPIYWLLDSGKKNGFKALIYMHRYNENLIPKARLDYLHRVQTTYEKLLSDVNYRLTTELSMTDKKEAKNKQTDLMAKLQEIKEYDEKIAHIANQRISIDLDDGVKVNYEKFKDILARIK